MLYYLLFWTLLGFIIHFYIIFGTNLLTGGRAQNCCFAYFSVSKKRNIKRNETFGSDLFGTNAIQESWSGSQEATEVATRAGAPPASWPPWNFPDFSSTYPRSHSFQKSRSRRFHSIWTPFDIPFLRNTETDNKTAIWVGPPVNRLVRKVI